MPPVAEGFDVKAAKDAGYSDDEILQHLTETRKFDIDGAVKAGYTKQEIIDHLSSSPTQVAQSGQPKTQTVFGKEAPASDPTQPIYPLRETILNGARHAEDSLNAVGRFLSHPIDNILVPATKFIASEGQVAPDENGQYRINQDPLSKTLGTIGRNAGAVVAPGSVNPATEQQNTEASEFAGEFGASTAIGAGMHGAAKIASPVIDKIGAINDQRMARKADLAAEKTANPQLYAPSLNTIAEATGNKASEAQFRDFADTWDTAAGEVKQSADKLFKGGITNNRQQIQAGRDAMDRIYNSEIGPKVALVESVDLKPLGEKLIREIPAQFTESERKAMTRFYQDQFNRTLTGPEMEQFRQKLTAASRLVLADSNYEQAAVTKSPAGFRLDAARDLVRDALANAVDKVQPGTDIRPSLAKYGKVTDLIQQAGGIPLDKTALELISGRSYITGTTPNITGRTVEALTKRWFANDNLIRRAYDQYKGPVVRPTSVPTGVNTLRGQQSDLIPHADGTTGAGSIPPAGSFGPLFESPMNQPMFRGDSISQQSKFGLRMPETMPPDSKPVNVLESLIPRPNGPTGLTTTNPLQHISVNGEFLSSEEFNRRFPNGLNAGRSPGQPMPVVTQSTRINPNQLYGPNPKLLSEGPFKFTIRGKLPDLVMQGTAGPTAARTGDMSQATHGSATNVFPNKNWVLDSTPHEQALTETHQGPGTLSTDNPKVVENTIASIQTYIEKNRPRGARLAELKQTQQDLLNQLKKFKASQPKGSK